jgi:hypothetical protein
MPNAMLNALKLVCKFVHHATACDEPLKRRGRIWVSSFRLHSFAGDLREGLTDERSGASGIGCSFWPLSSGSARVRHEEAAALWPAARMAASFRRQKNAADGYLKCHSSTKGKKFSRFYKSRLSGKRQFGLNHICFSVTLRR